MIDDDVIDLSPNKDGKITKKILRHGNTNLGNVYPQDTVEISWKMYNLDGILVHQSNNTNEPFSFRLNANPREVILGWEYGILTMYEGEISTFKISPEFAFGSKGALPLIPPNTTLITEIELLSIIPNIKRKYKPVGINESISDELIENIRTGKSSIAQEVMENKKINETKSIENLKFFDEKKHKIDPNQLVKGENKNYIWEETPKHIDVELKLPTQMTKSDLLIDIKPSTVRIVVMSTGEVILDDKWHGRVVPSESTWAILEPEVTAWYRGYRLLLSLQKAHDSKDIWANVIAVDTLVDEEAFG